MSRESIKDALARVAWHDEVLAIICALEAAGYAIVPKAPTSAMICAALDDHDKKRSAQSYSDVWSAMVSAACSPAPGPERA